MRSSTTSSDVQAAFFRFRAVEGLRATVERGRRLPEVTFGMGSGRFGGCAGALALDLLETRPEFLQSSLEIVNPLTEDARTAGFRAPKPFFQAGVSLAEHRLHLVTLRAGHTA